MKTQDHHAPVNKRGYRNEGRFAFTDPREDIAQAEANLFVEMIKRNTDQHSTIPMYQ